MRSYFHENDIQTFETTSAVFRLAKKYGVNHLRDEARRRLYDEMPSTLEARDKLHIGWRIKKFSSHMIDYINLAREEGLVRAIPYCFVRLSRYPISTIFNGCMRLDRTTAILPVSDQQIAIVGIERLRDAIIAEMFGWLNVDKSITGSCERSACLQTRFDHAMTLLKPPSTLALGRWQPSWKDGLCMACLASAKEVYEAGRKRVWDKLPSYFALPGWNDMQDE
jgi:hypothetical protein